MSYTEFLSNPYHENFGFITLGIAIGFIAFVILFAWGVAAFEGAVTTTRKKAISFIVFGVLGMVMTIGVTNSAINASYAIDDKNEAIAEQNLKQKYDIEGVMWANSQADFDSEHGIHYIRIHDSENNILKFQYKVDQETLEPHLLNIEDDDLISPNKTIKSKDLLRSEK